jgi:hypothetical protein
MGGTFRFRYANSNPIIKVFPSGSTGAVVDSSDAGHLIVSGSTAAAQGARGEMPLNSTAATMKVIGILTGVSAATTQGSTTACLYVQIIKPGDVLEANYSTTVNGTTGGFTAATALVTTNIGYYLGLGARSDGTPLGKYVDVSFVSTSPMASSSIGANTAAFKLLDWSTQNDSVGFTVDSSCLRN